MSNTSAVTPIDTSASEPSLVAACLAGAAVAPVALARWLSAETTEDREALADLEHTQRRELLSAGATRDAVDRVPADVLRISSTRLRTREIEPLVAAAERLGFRREPRVPSEGGLSDLVMLIAATGERLALTRDATGRVNLHEAGSTRLAQRVTRRHTTDRVVAHQESRGMHVTARDLGDGQVEIEAREKQEPGADGTRVVTTVKGDGSAVVDIDGVCGDRCEKVVRGIAEAIGGVVTNTTRRPAFFQRPGESATVKVRA